MRRGGSSRRAVSISRLAQFRSVLVRAEDDAVVLGEDRNPDSVGDRVLDEPDAAVAETNVHASRVHTPALATAVIHPTAAVEAHALLGRIHYLLAQNRAGLHLVTAVVAALHNIESLEIVRRRVVRLRMTGEACHAQAHRPHAANVGRGEPRSQLGNGGRVRQSVRH